MKRKIAIRKSINGSLRYRSKSCVVGGSLDILEYKVIKRLACGSLSDRDSKRFESELKKQRRSCMSEDDAKETNSFKLQSEEDRHFTF
jgi:hypothetical protein